MRTFITAAAPALALALIASTGSAQEATTFDIETDPETGMANIDNFSRSFDEMGYYDRLDLDGDGMLSRDEYNRAVYARYDMDRDEMLNEEEMMMMGEDPFFSEGIGQAQGEAQTNN